MKIYGFSDKDFDIKDLLNSGKMTFTLSREINNILDADRICICENTALGIMVLFVELDKESAIPSLTDGEFFVCFSIKSVSKPSERQYLSSFRVGGNPDIEIPEDKFSELSEWSIDLPIQPDKPNLADFAQEIADAFGVKSSQVSISISNLNSKD